MSERPTDRPIRVTIWNEFLHERHDESVRANYPRGMHAVIGDALERELGARVTVRHATLDMPEHGLTDDVLETTDVLTWWGHRAHQDVSDEVVAKVVDRVRRGMGLLVLHSAHFSKVFRALMGTSCRLRWRNGNDRELVWSVDPAHPIARGVPVPIVIPEQEMYGEFFDIPAPDELVFISSFSGGEVFRSGCCFHRGHGKIFYFSPGDQEYPVYHHPAVGRVLANGVEWAAPTAGVLDREYAPELCGTGWYDEEIAEQGAAQAEALAAEAKEGAR
ncbi:ThuA domain-containing protein [Planotetraspora kaengkrachanensis]|uniref:Trehalose utilization protein ThuA n=1 Tax=Planotetraspora kaengkrachanensis TaxID=575193 RepID=A0A8J3PVU2_9ACTN|nr:ThuA domain-containing protein [Planotetraspora kaengkrachanensis]GIG82021.1 trehalose utilization protein ThuA [Planotetraspora kaengkrachanensis]